MTVANRVISPVLGAAHLAGDFGVPYIGVAASLLQGIQESCERVVVHKKECISLSNRAAEMLSQLQEQAPNLKESALRQYADDFEMTLNKIHTRMQRWAQMGRIAAFLQDGKIAAAIKAFDKELNTQSNNFNFNSMVVIQTDTAHVRAMTEQTHASFQELIRLILEHPEGAKRVKELGAEVALMEEGQNALRRIRENEETNAPQSHQRRGTNGSHITFASPHIPERSQEYQDIQRALTELYKRLRTRPQVYNLNGEVSRVGDIPVSGGTYSDVWMGLWMGDQKVALKALREVRTTAQKSVKRFEREVTVWSELDHPNILQFLGIVTDIGNFLQIVSSWQDNGNLLDFVKKNPETADRIHLLAGASKGLSYLHKRKVVHGNLKCSNILVSENKEALISDFGMAKVVEDVTEQSASATLTKAGSARWLAPEVIEGEIDFPDQACDVYSFGMTMYECLSGAMPFPTLRRDAQVIHKIIQEEVRPPRPVEGENGENANNARWCTDEVWNVLEHCWLRKPEERWTMEQVAEELGRIDEERAGEATPRVASPVPMDVDAPEASASE